jgi:hypothetical protein
MLVYVHGNCQAPPLAAMLREVYPEWRIDSYECFNTKIVDEIERYREIVASADILLSQPIHDGYRGRDDLSLSFLRAHARPGAALVVIPSLHFDGQLVSWRSVGFPGHGMDYHDMTLFQLAASELDAEAVVDILMDEALYPETFVAREIEIALAETQRREREDGVDAKAADYIAERVRAEPLFHVINHPARSLLAHVANSALGCLGQPRRVASEGEDLLPIPHVPLAPSVARALGLDVDAHFLLPGERLTRPDYYRRAVQAVRALPGARRAEGLRHPAALPFLNRLAQAVPGLT